MQEDDEEVELPTVARECRCFVDYCEWHGVVVPNEYVAHCVGIWHIYRQHPDVWRDKYPFTTPSEPDPESAVGWTMMARVN